jgi:hypothetical protein
VLFSWLNLFCYHFATGCFIFATNKDSSEIHGLLNADEPRLFMVAEDDGIAVNDPGAYERLGMRTGGRKKQNNQDGKQDA